MSPYPTRSLMGLIALVFIGTLYSVVQNTYLDTSNPLLTHLPHPLQKTHYFASKSNVVNVLFTKKLWAWTSTAFWLLFLTSPRKQRMPVLKWCAESLIWLMFTTWFFGPALLERVTVSTGGECVVHLPSGVPVSVPEQLCYSRSRVTLQSHPELFAASLVLPADTWSQVPRIRRGHDVSGHLFLLTMSILLLSEQFQVAFRHSQRNVSQTPWYRWFAIVMTFSVISMSYFAAWTTSIYFHTPTEKLSGILLGIAAFSVTRLPVFESSTQMTTRRIELQH